MEKTFIQKLGFLPKENTSGVFSKKFLYGYCIELDFEKDTFHFGGKIKIQ
jgi:type I restriction enzyme M protein